MKFEKSKDSHILWLEKRIKELKEFYDSIEYKNSPERKLMAGGKLCSYKQVLDYIRTH